MKGKRLSVSRFSRYPGSGISSLLSNHSLVSSNFNWKPPSLKTGFYSTISYERSLPKARSSRVPEITLNPFVTIIALHNKMPRIIYDEWFELSSISLETSIFCSYHQFFFSTNTVYKANRIVRPLTIFLEHITIPNSGRRPKIPPFLVETWKFSRHFSSFPRKKKKGRKRRNEVKTKVLCGWRAERLRGEATPF